MNVKLSEFGGPKYPLRPSALAWLGRCPVQAVLAMMSGDDEGGEAAQTGSLTHAAVAAFHLEPDVAKRIGAAAAAMKATAPKFPLADLNEARLYFEPYAADPRNQRAVFAAAPKDYRRKDGTWLRKGQPAIEVPVSLELEPHRLDPTGLPILINGTLDQIRIVDAEEAVDDLKTGKALSGLEMLHDYALQQAAYVLAARASGFPNAGPGRIIRAYGYRTRGAMLPSPDGVFWHHAWDVAGAEALMARVQLMVALIRQGEIDFGPGTHCARYCPQKGLDACMPLARRNLFSLPLV